MTAKKQNENTSAIAKQNTGANDMLTVVANAAANPDVDAEKMEKLLDMQIRLTDKNAEIEFNKAFAALQQEIPRITKRGKIVVRGKNQSDYGRYEDLDRVLRPLLSKHGMALRFTSHPDEAGKGAIYEGTLTHSDGHSIQSQMWLPYDHSGSKNSVQAGGSTMSYAQRYLAVALLNIVFEGADDDAQSVSAKISKEQVADLEKRIKATGADKTKFCKFAGVSKLADIPASDWKKISRALDRKAKQGDSHGRGI